MKLFAVALMFFVSVLLVVSLVYIITINRTKLRLALIEKGLDPKDHMDDRFYMNAIRAGYVFAWAGCGFLIALGVDEYLFPGLDNPALYAGSVLLCAGIGLILYYKFYNPK